jgi:DNA-binding GntR family transcriptional regulator
MPVGQSGAAGGGFVGPADGLQYLELRNHIAARIAAGELNPGDRLPSERQLQTASLLARGTIREGLSQLEAQGRQPATETLDAAEISADAFLAGVFDRPVGAPLYRIRRRRFIDHRAVLVEHIIVNVALAPNLLRFSLDSSLTSILKAEYGLSVVRNKIEMHPCALTGREAEALKLRSGQPGLKVVRTSYDALSRVVEFDREYWRHDAMKISVEARVR